MSGNSPLASEMEATRAYANDPPVLLSTGLAGALALPGPDQIPLDPAVLDDPRRRWRGLGALDAVGVLRLHVRNPAGYAFLRPKLNKKFSDQYAGLNFSMTKAAVQTTYYRSRYHDYVPNDMLTSMVADSIRCVLVLLLWMHAVSSQPPWFHTQTRVEGKANRQAPGERDRRRERVRSEWRAHRALPLGPDSAAGVRVLQR